MTGVVLSDILRAVVHWVTDRDGNIEFPFTPDSDGILRFRCRIGNQCFTLRFDLDLFNHKVMFAIIESSLAINLVLSGSECHYGSLSVDWKIHQTLNELYNKSFRRDL